MMNDDQLIKRVECFFSDFWNFRGIKKFTKKILSLEFNTLNINNKIVEPPKKKKLIQTREREGKRMRNKTSVAQRNHKIFNQIIRDAQNILKY